MKALLFVTTITPSFLAKYHMMIERYKKEYEWSCIVLYQNQADMLRERGWQGPIDILLAEKKEDPSLSRFDSFLKLLQSERFEGLKVGNTDFKLAESIGFDRFYSWYFPEQAHYFHQRLKELLPKEKIDLFVSSMDLNLMPLRKTLEDMKGNAHCLGLQTKPLIHKTTLNIPLCYDEYWVDTESDQSFLCHNHHITLEQIRCTEPLKFQNMTYATSVRAQKSYLLQQYGLPETLNLLLFQPRHTWEFDWCLTHMAERFQQEVWAIFFSSDADKDKFFVLHPEFEQQYPQIKILELCQAPLWISLASTVMSCSEFSAYQDFLPAESRWIVVDPIGYNRLQQCCSPGTVVTSAALLQQQLEAVL